jgi:hypothetical protein
VDPRVVQFSCHCPRDPRRSSFNFTSLGGSFRWTNCHGILTCHLSISQASNPHVLRHLHHVVSAQCSFQTGQLLVPTNTRLRSALRAVSLRLGNVFFPRIIKSKLHLPAEKGVVFRVNGWLDHKISLGF